MNTKIRTIYYLCPCDNTPIGGNHKIYDHVQILNNAGYSAYVLHSKLGFECTWFKHKAKLAYYTSSPMQKAQHFLRERLGRSSFTLRWFKGLKLQTRQGILLPPISEEDVLVIPEYEANRHSFYEKGLPFVIFNQNSYHTFNYLSLPKTCYDITKIPQAKIYHAKNLLGIMTVSSDNMAYLKLAFPDIPLFHIRQSINRNLFFYDSSQKRRLISYMPRKLEQVSKQVILILKERSKCVKWKFYPIDGVNQEEVADILKTSSIFLSCAYQEGFFLPAAEAMACGCISIGYHAESGKEYFYNSPSIVIESGNVRDFVLETERLMAVVEEEPYQHKEALRQQSNKILSHYSEENEKEDLIKAWIAFQNILNLKNALNPGLPPNLA